MTQFAMANAADFCTVYWASEKVGISVRSIRRYIADGRLTACSPRCGRGEHKSSNVLLMVSEVEQLRAARQVLAKKETA